MTTPSEDTVNISPSLRESVPSIRQLSRTYTIGILMGSADVVPGISGGTVALIAGIYERLIAAITSITPDRLVELLRAVLPVDDSISPERAGEILEEIDAWFILTLVTGVGTGIVIVGQAVEFASTHTPVALFGFFFGLIAASAAILLREITMNTVRRKLAAISGFLTAFLLSGEVRFLEGEGLVIVFVAGAIAVSAMILPGISGSLLLVILGQYTRMYAALNDFLGGSSGCQLAVRSVTSLDPDWWSLRSSRVAWSDCSVSLGWSGGCSMLIVR